MQGASNDKQPSETTPLVEKAPVVEQDEESDLKTAYGMDSHGTWVKSPNGAENLVDYEPLKFSSFRVCFVGRGTIWDSPVLMVEQMILITIFAAMAIPVYVTFHDDVASGKGAPSVKRFLSQQEDKMRQFAMIMTGLAAFLLSFYTSIAVTRWWTMRTGGIGGIKAATVDLQLLLYQAVCDPKKDKDVLDAVRRYGRTSLFLIFMWRCKQTGDNEKLKSMLVDRDLLKPDEAEQLLKWNKHCLHETIWAWQMAIVNKLYKEKKISSDQLYALLLQKVLDGRQAVQLVHTHLAVRVPMQYVHLLGLLVKMHNFVLAVIMGILFGAALRQGQVILCAQLIGRIFILPFLFNAILLINCDLADPFSGSEADFPGEIYQANIGKDCVGMMGATDNAPELCKLFDGPAEHRV